MFRAATSLTLTLRRLRSGRRWFSGDKKNPVALIFDTETTHKVAFDKPAWDPCQPDLIQLGLILVDTSDWSRRMQTSMLVQPQKEIIDPGAQAVHGISAEDCDLYGVTSSCAVQLFSNACQKADVVVAHNLAFDDKVMETAMHRATGSNADNGLQSNKSLRQQRVCTMQSSTDVLKLPAKWGGSYKWPTLQEAYAHFAIVKEEEVNETPAVIEGAHDALVDAEACLAVFRGLLDSGAITLQDVCSNEEVEANNVVVVVTDSSSSLPPGLVPVQQGELGIKLVEEGFQVYGETFKHKESLKLFGARWNPIAKVWEFHGHSMLDPMKRFAHIPRTEDDSDNIQTTILK